MALSKEGCLRAVNVSMHAKSEHTEIYRQFGAVLLLLHCIFHEPSHKCTAKLQLQDLTRLRNLCQVRSSWTFVIRTQNAANCGSNIRIQMA